MGSEPIEALQFNILSTLQLQGFSGLYKRVTDSAVW